MLGRTRNILVHCAVIATALACGQARADVSTLTGSWALTATAKHGVDMRFAARSQDSNWEWRDTLALSDLHGLTAQQLASEKSTVRFSVERDAGTFDCNGWIANGNGGGSFTYSPSLAFARALADRGIAAPTPSEQLEFAMSGLTLAFIDKLRHAGYKLQVSDLLRLSDHGVDNTYVDAITAAGYLPTTSAELIQLRDHGVDADYIRSLAKYGISKMTGDELVRLRDHGVEPEYLAALRSSGYAPSAQEAIELADHGISATYVRDLRQLGYAPSVAELVRLADHGVSTGWIKQLRGQGLHPTVDDLVRLRDAGV